MQDIRNTLDQLPTRAEFIRDRLAEHLDGLGYDVETTDHGAQLTAEGADCQPITLEVIGERLLDIDTGAYVLFRGFRRSWVAEPTDTGVMHGPWPAQLVFTDGDPKYLDHDGAATNCIHGQKAYSCAACTHRHHP